MANARSPRSLNIWLLPAMLYITAWTIFPTIYLFYISLLDWNLAYKDITFVGLENYANMFVDPAFYKSLQITIGWAVSATGLELGVGFAIALMLDRDNILAKAVRLLLVIPLMMTPILIMMLWKYLFTPALGPMIYIASVFGIYDPHFLARVPQVYFSLLLVDIWQWTPFITLILLAGLFAVPRTMKESAEIDGAGRWATFRYIIVPFTKPIFLIALLFRFVDSLKVFNKIFALSGGGPGSATDVLSFHIFVTGVGLTLNVGTTAAWSVIYLLITMGMATALMVVVFRSSKEAATK